MRMIGKGDMTVKYNGEIIGTTCFNITTEGKDAILDINFNIPTTHILLPINIEVHDINHKETDVIIEGREIHYLENKE
jgi:hypothetical protein